MGDCFTKEKDTSEVDYTIFTKKDIDFISRSYMIRSTITNIRSKSNRKEFNNRLDNIISQKDFESQNILVYELLGYLNKQQKSIK